METGDLRGFPLSAQQRRLWRLHRKGLPCAARCSVSLRGALDRGRLRAAFAAVVERHEILRARFVRRAGLRIPVQGIGDPCLPVWLETDLRGLRGPEQDAEVRRLWEAEILSPADLERPGPALRLDLLHLAPETWELLVTLPALCADGPSLDRLIAESAAVYDGRDAEDDPLQFLDYADWQNELLESAAAPPGIAGLAARLALDLPLARRGAAPRWSWVEVPVPVDAGLAAELQAAAAAAGVPFARWLLAGWAALMARLGDRTDLTIGLVLDGRSLADVQGTLGPLARCVPATLSVPPGIPTTELLRRVGTAEQEAARQSDRFAWDGVEGDPAVPLRCPVGFESWDRPASSQASGLSFQIVRRRAPVDSFAVQLAAIDDGAATRLKLRVDPGVVRPDTALLMADQLAALLGDAAGRPEAATGDLSLLTAAERRRVLVDFNGTPGEWGNRPVHRLFAEQARRTPGAVAVVCEEQEITYETLADRAAELAGRLRALGVGPEVSVGLFLERSVEMVVGLLGVLEAGGCYLPLDPLLPASRLAALLEAARPVVVVTKRRLSPALRLDPAACVELDAPDDPSAGAPVDARATASREPGPANAAYVLFTSGSTGHPKGVVVEHRQLGSYVAAVLERLALPAGASFATVSTLGADLGNTAIFPALVSGGALHVLTHRQAGDAAALAAQLARRPVDVLKIVPSHLAALLASSGSKAVLPRRCLVLGGEAFGWELAGTLRSLAPDLAVFNHYGPTEATVGAVAGRLDETLERDELSVTVPLGRPLANSRLFLLDRAGGPVPRGLPGEVFIGGGGVARGYLGDPRQTAERFAPDPFGADGGRLYRTGDLARRLPDGRIEFLGRLDDQMKIRGFRIEPAEIVAVLTAHPAVREAAVAARTEAGGERRLVAYLVERPGRSAALHELRDFLRERLPEHMVPAAFVPLAFLPRTPNGKLDRQALPAPAAGRAASELPYVVPRTDAEQEVSAIWQQILTVERVGLYDNFFDLGGHSLHMVQVQSRVRERFQREVSIVELFRYPTVSALASLLSGGPATSSSSGEGEDRAQARKAALDRRRSRTGVEQVDHV